jgi:hypothetical protein
MTSNSLVNYQIVCLPIVAWDTIHQRPHHLMTEFAQLGATVYYINPHFTSPTNKVFTNITRTPKVLEVLLKDSPYRKLTGSPDIKAYMTPQVHEVSRKLSGLLDPDKSTIIWVNAPYWEPVLKEIIQEIERDANNDEVKVVYDVMDHFTCFTDLAPHKYLLDRMHVSLLLDSDLVTYTAKSMLGTLINKNSSSNLYLPNACHPEIWDIPRAKQNPDFVGYFGVMADWFDVELLQEVAALSEINVVLIGPIDEHRGNQIRGMNNVWVYGIKPHSQLPKDVRNWSCAFIPFKEYALTHATDPVKLYEFMAAGLPVVSVELDEIKALVSTIPDAAKPILVKPGNRKGFAESILQAIKSDTPEKSDLRKAWAKKQKWSDRAITVLKRLGIT